MAQTIPFSRNIENDARDSERMALGEVLDDMLEDIHDDVSPKDVRNGRLSAEALEDGQDTRMDVLFRISSKNSGKNGGDWITIATQVTKGVYEYAGTIPAKKSAKLEITDNVTNGFRDLELAGVTFRYNGREYQQQQQ